MSTRLGSSTCGWARSRATMMTASSRSPCVVGNREQAKQRYQSTCMYAFLALVVTDRILSAMLNVRPTYL